MQSHQSFFDATEYHTTLHQSTLNELITGIYFSKSPLIIDEKVYHLFKDRYTFPQSPRLLLLSAGENNKSQHALSSIYDFLLNNNVSRHSVVYVIGGGSVTDIAAYAVSTFKRGCQLCLIPSTLLGMVDAAIGGKTAINYNNAKNLIGTFYPAGQVFIIPEFLNTLPDIEINNGLAEMLKLRFIIPDLPIPVDKPDAVPTPAIIFQYAKTKLEICAHDPIDLKSRRLLNLGHTFGHILETYTNFAIPHGEAVIWGISTAARISRKLNLIDNACSQQIISEVNKYGFKTELDSGLKSGFVSAFPNLVKLDKKGNNSKLTLVLFAQDNHVIIHEDILLDTILPVLPDCL